MKPEETDCVQLLMDDHLTIWKDDFISYVSTSMFRIGSENRPPHARGWSCVESTGEHPVLAFSLLPVHVEFENHYPIVLSPGTVAVTASNGSYTRSKLHDAGQRTIFFGIPDQFISGYCAQFDPSIVDRHDNPFPDRYAPVCPRAISMARQLERLIFEASSMTDPMLVDECVLWILERSFHELLTPHSRQHRINYSRETFQLQRRQINQAAASLAINPRNQWSLPTLADEIGLSPGYLSRTFRNHTGSTITQYLSILRVIYALQLLDDFKGNLTGLAYESGFSSHAHMTTVFMKLVGKTPSSMIASHQHGIIDSLMEQSHRIDQPP